MPEDNHPKTILLVEDEALIALSETRQLQTEGYYVLYAQNGEIAVRMASQNQVHIDLILMDIDLGSGIDGTEAARQILTTYDIPIVFLSSHTEKEIVEKTEEITSYGYVAKESSPTVLFASIHMAFKLHHAHTRLKESEEKYRRLIEGAPDIVYTLSNHRGGVYYSPQVTRVLGYSVDYLYARPYLWNESIHPDDHALVGKATLEFEAGKPFDIQYRILNSKGEWIWLRDRSIGGQVIGDDILIEGLATDITESRLADETIRNSEKRYRDLIENAPIAIFQSSLEGKIIVVNPLFTSLLGYSSAEDLRMTLNDNANGIFADPKRRAEVVRLRLENPELKEFINLYRRKDGSTFYGRLQVRSILDPTGQVASFEGYIDFVSAGDQPPQPRLSDQNRQSFNTDDRENRNQARIQPLQAKIDQLEIYNREHILVEKKLRESADGLRVIFENAPDAIVLIEPAARILLDANKAACLLLGKPLEDIRGMHQSQLYLPEFEIFSEQPLDQAAMATKGVVHPMEYKLLRADGSQVLVEIDAQLIHIQNRPILMSTFRDISPHKEVERKLIERERHAIALFDNSPLGLWEEDFSGVKTRMDELFADGMVDLRTYLDEHPSEVTDLAARIKILSINQSGVYLLGAKSKDEIARDLPRYFTQKSLEIFKEEIIALAAGKTYFSSEFPILDMAGQTRIYALKLMVMPGFESSLAHVIISFIDQGDHILAEEKINMLLREKELLLKEVHHRIKNNMSSIASLLHLQMDAEKIPSARMALQDAEGRVLSMMVLYDKLYRSLDFNSIPIRDYLPALLQEIVDLFQTNIPIEIATQFEDIVLPSRLQSPLGIILNEMTTNAIKHAFTGRSSGKISVTATQTSNRVSFQFQDNGIGLPKTAYLKSSTGFGMQLIGMLVNQIGGMLTIKREVGTAYLIEFDLK